MVDPGYLAKKNPVRLRCEVCGVLKDCVPCGNHRWCRRGRCPICFPTILQLFDKGTVSSSSKQLEMQKRIWDMEFWCETCNQIQRKPPILKDILEFPDGKMAVAVGGCEGWYMTKDGTLLNASEYHQLTGQQKRPPSAPTAAAAGQQGAQRPASAPQLAQRPSGPQQKPAAAGAAAGAGLLKEKRPAEGGEPVKKRSKTTAAAAAAQGGGGSKRASAAQQQKLKAAAAAGGSESSSDEELDSSSDNDAAAAAVPPAKKAGTAAAAAGAGAGKAAAVPAKQPRPPDQRPAAAAAGESKPALAQAGKAAPAAGGGSKPTPAQVAKAAAAAAAANGIKPSSAQAGKAAAAAVVSKQLAQAGKAAAGPKQLAQAGNQAAAAAAAAGAAKAVGTTQAQTAAARLQQQQQAASKQRSNEPPAAESPKGAAAAVAAKKPLGPTPPAAATAAKPPAAAAVKDAARKLSRSSSPAPAGAKTAATAAQGLKRRIPEDSSSSEGLSSDGVPLTDLPAHIQTKNPAAAAAGGGAQGSKLKPVGSAQQQQQRGGLSSKPSGGAATKQPAAATAAAAGGVPKAASKPAAIVTKAAAPGAAAPKVAAAGAGKRDPSRKQQQDKAAGAGRPLLRQQPQQEEASRSEEDESGPEESPDGDSLDHDLDAEQAIFGSGPSDEPDVDTAKQKDGKAKARQGAAAAAAAPEEGAAKTNGRQGAAAAAVIAEEDAAKAKGPRRKAFNLLDIMQDGAAAVGDALVPGNSGQADALAAAAAAAAEEARATARQREAAVRSSSNLWPFKCKVEAAGPNFRYEFAARIKEGPNRSGVQVPSQLEKHRDGTLRCMFWTGETMLNCVQADAANGVQYEAVFNQPAPLVLTEFALLREDSSHLPSVVRFMIQHKSYLRVWTDSGSLFFGCMLKDSGHVADWSSAELQRQKAEHLPDLMSSDLGLVMFKDLKEEAPPAAYGKVDSLDTQVSPKVPIWLAAQAAVLYDESWLYDTNLDNFYEQEVIDTVIASGAHMHMDMHMSDMYMNGVHGVDWDEQQQQQQQWQLPGLATGMGQALLPAAGGSGRQRMPRRPSEPGYEAFMGDASPGCAYAPTEHASGSEQQQQQQQDGEQDYTGLQEGDTPSGGVSPSAAAAAAPAEPELDEQQMRQLSPLQQLLRGGRPAWPLMPSADTVLELLRTKGPEALVVYLDEGSFADYLQEWKASAQSTRDYVRRARQHGVTVYAPDDPPEVPQPGTVHIVVVTKAEMQQNGFEISTGKGHLTEYLVSGALVVREQFIADLAELPSGPDLQLTLARDDVALWKSLRGSFFRTGIWLLLDLSLLLTTGASELYQLLLQLHGLRGIIHAAGEPKAQVQAFAMKLDLAAASYKWLGDDKLAQYMSQLTRDQPHLCQELSAGCISRKQEPVFTHMLRNAHKVTYNFNNPKQQGTIPLRYTIVVTAEPNSLQLTPEQREGVRELLNNDDGNHKTVIGATLKQTRHLLSVIREQLSS